MNRRQLTAARTIWRARRERTGTDRAYALYVVVLLAGIVVAPIIHTLWAAVSGPSGAAVLSSVHAPGVVSILTATLWAGGFLLGRRRGPALLPPFLLYALTSSRARRSVALRQPLVRSAAIIVVAYLALRY